MTTPDTVWRDVFRKRSHTFTDKEILDSKYTDLGPLAQHCPGFWEEYDVRGGNKKKLEDIWSIEYDWSQAVLNQDFNEAKRLFRILQKIKKKDWK